VGGTQLAADALQRILVEIALPVGFEGFFSSRSAPMRGKPRVWAKAMVSFLP
jgi:hypothetical protein